MPDNKNNKNPTPNFDKKAFKHAISTVESQGGRRLGNSESSASGRYHFLYNLIKDAPELKGISKREWINDNELQERVMDLALDNKLQGFTYGPAYAQKFIEKHNSTLSLEKATALIHFLGPGDAVKAIKDPENFKPKGSNLSVDDYLGRFSKNYKKYNQYKAWMKDKNREIQHDEYGHAILKSDGFEYDPNKELIQQEESKFPKPATSQFAQFMDPDRPPAEPVPGDLELDPTQINTEDRQREEAQAQIAAAQQAYDQNQQAQQPRQPHQAQTFRIGDQQTVGQAMPGTYRIDNQQNIQGVNQFMFGGMMGEQLGQVGGNAEMAGATKAGGPGVGGYAQAAMGAFELGQMAFGKTGIDKSGITPPEDVPSKGSAALSGAMKGASAGASFGPWGMAAGAVIGGAAGLIGNAKMEKEMNEADIAYTGNLHNQATNDYAMGGNIGGAPTETAYDASQLVTKFENGGSHSQNSLGGIPQGIGANGKPNLVEEGETKWNDYIFSNNITTDGKMIVSDSSDNKFAEGGDLEDPNPKPKPKSYSKSQQKAMKDSIRAIKKIYGEDIDAATINTILSNIEIETSFNDLRENSYSFDRIKELGDGDLYSANKNLDKWGKGKDAYNKLSKAERMSVMYYGDTDHADIAGGTGVLQLTSSNYGGNSKTEDDITKASKQLGLSSSGLANNFYDSTLLTLQVMKNRGHDFSSFGNAKDARFSVVNPGQDYDKMDAKKQAILDNDYSSYYGNMNSSVDPSIITNNTGLDQSTRDRFLKANMAGKLTPDVVEKLSQRAPVANTQTNPMLASITQDPNKDLFSGEGLNYEEKVLSPRDQEEFLKNIGANSFQAGGQLTESQAMVMLKRSKKSWAVKEQIDKKRRKGESLLDYKKRRRVRITNRKNILK